MNDVDKRVLRMSLLRYLNLRISSYFNPLINGKDADGDFLVLHERNLKENKEYNERTLFIWNNGGIPSQLIREDRDNYYNKYEIREYYEFKGKSMPYLMSRHEWTEEPYINEFIPPAAKELKSILSKIGINSKICLDKLWGDNEYAFFLRMTLDKNVIREIKRKGGIYAFTTALITALILIACYIFTTYNETPKETNLYLFAFLSTLPIVVYCVANWFYGCYVFEKRAQDLLNSELFKFKNGYTVSTDEIDNEVDDYITKMNIITDKYE